MFFNEERKVIIENLTTITQYYRELVKEDPDSAITEETLKWIALNEIPHLIKDDEIYFDSAIMSKFLSYRTINITDELEALWSLNNVYNSKNVKIRTLEKAIEELNKNYLFDYEIIIADIKNIIKKKDINAFEINNQIYLDYAALQEYVKFLYGAV